MPFNPPSSGFVPTVAFSRLEQGGNWLISCQYSRIIPSEISTDDNKHRVVSFRACVRVCVACTRVQDVFCFFFTPTPPPVMMQALMELCTRRDVRTAAAGCGALVTSAPLFPPEMNSSMSCRSAPVQPGYHGRYQGTLHSEVHTGPHTHSEFQ